MNILIIKLGALGDVLRTTGILKGLHNRYGNPKIFWLTKPQSFPLLEKNPLIHKVASIDDWEEILGTDFDLVISLDDEEEACKIAREAKKKSIVGVYLDENGKRAYTKSEWFDMSLLGGPDRDELKKRNTKTFQQHMAEMLGIEKTEMEPMIFLGEKEKQFQRKFREENNISAGEILIGINTGAGERWQYKKLGEEKTANLINSIYENLGYRAILLGGHEERERNARIAAQAKVPLIDAGTDHPLLEFAAIVDLCDILITSDSLALHIGTALKKKVIVFFGPTSIAEIELFGRGKKIAPRMTCLVCYKRRCDFNPACMHLITVDQLLMAIKEVSA